MPHPPRRRLSVEYLEDRTTPTASPWLNPGQLTISFVPDGTATGAGASDLSAMATASGSTLASWEQTIVQAFQTWASQANINLGVVQDQGQPLGTNGLIQGDPRFGDIRIAAAPLGNTATAGLAETVTANPSAGTFSGDMVFNSNAPISIGGAYDLFSVALHEAGHSFGFPDEPTDPTSVMYTTYQTATGLGQDDVAAIQSMYGSPSGDPFGGGVTNSTVSTAFDLTRYGNLTNVGADISQTGGSEVFRFTTPAASTRINSLTVNVRAAGTSLLTPQVTILNSAGAVVASATAAGPLANSLSVALPNYQPGTTYYVQVQGAQVQGDTAGVFSSGAYNLQLSYGPTSYGNSFNLGATYVNTGSGHNLSILSAQSLGFSSATETTDFTAVGSLNAAGTSNWYRITPTTLSGFTGTLTVGVVGLAANGLLPTITVYNTLGQQLPAAVVANQNGTFTVQLAGQTTGTTYYLQVSAASSTGANATGSYALWADLSQIAPTTFSLLSSGTLTAAASTSYSTLTTNGTRLTQFSLSASDAAGSATAAVRMTIFDANGNQVFTLVAYAGAPLVTGSVWLAAGTYTVVFNAAVAGGSLPAITYQFSDLYLSEPDDPTPVDPTDPTGTTTTPTGTSTNPLSIVVSPPTALPPSGGLVGSLVSPLVGTLGNTLGGLLGGLGL